ncbi:MAG: aldehyde dehydrogenase family protein [Candidatus Hydrogenedentes bacterium]|nr:aldehyde dehydrogenase family protein [Candidatus Hydrogenedentota bacterium]
MKRDELTVTNPYSGEMVCRVPLMDEGEVNPMVQQARAAFREWRAAPPAERGALCRKAMEFFGERRDAIALDITQQMGKPLRQAIGEVNRMLERAEYLIDIAEKTLADEWLPELAGFKRYIRHEPMGVVLDIAAWNYPLLIAVNVIVPAVLAGNAVLVKHSRRTPLCGTAFEDAYRAAGAPDGLVQAVTADHEVVEKLIRHPGVDYVSFTGSVRGGRELTYSVAGRFIPIGLELGGKDPAYVCADAPFDFAVENCVDGAFYNAGQSCCAIERIYVDQNIYDDFVEAYVRKTSEYALGDPCERTTTLGPLAQDSARQFLGRQVEEAVSSGGRCLISAADFEMPARGFFFAPTVVADAPQTCSLMQEESFGPAIGIRAVSDDDEAISLMNDSRYGLTASIWTSDLGRAIRIGEQIDTGTFYMNRCDYLDPALPWCGVKDTGRGCSLSHYGFLPLTRLKSMHLREVPG